MCAPDMSGARDGLSAHKLAHDKGRNYSLAHKNANQKLSEPAHTARYKSKFKSRKRNKIN